MTRRIAIHMVGLLAILGMLVSGCPAAPTTFALTIRVDPPASGTATFTGTSPFDPGAVIPVTATANPGFEFFRWTATAGAFVDPLLPSTTFTMPREAATITAHFRELRTEGFWLDQITIHRQPVHATGVMQLVNCEFEVYAHALTARALYDQVVAEEHLYYKPNIGFFNTFYINPYGPLFLDGSLNPFYLFDFPAGVRTLQEVLHKFVDRNYIADDIQGGMAWPSWTSQHTQLADYARYFDDTYIALNASIGYLETLYGYDTATGHAWLNATMAAINTIIGNITGSAATGWLFNGEPIVITLAIRNDDPDRLAIGDYVGAQLEEMGFVFDPYYGNMAVTLHALANNLPRTRNGEWNIYTAGWAATVISRDDSWRFLYFHTNFWAVGIPSYTYLDVPDDFWDAAYDLAWLYFSTFDERDALYELALPPHMKFGQFYLVDEQGFGPLKRSVDLAHDLAGGIAGSWMWALTAHFRGPAPTYTPIFGGHLRAATHDLLVEPWNPIAGSNTLFDMFPIRATGDVGIHPDTRDGLFWPGRIARAEVTVRTGLPVKHTLPRHDWVTLSFDDTIAAPLDAWRAWNFTNHTPITVETALANPAEAWGLNASFPNDVERYSVAYYPADIWTHPLHDGSTLSFADFLYGWLLTYERGMGNITTNPMWDGAQAPLTASTLRNVVAIKFTVNPEPGYGLKVETWSRIWEFDVERMVTTMFPNYAQGNGFWHTIALGVRGERDGLMAFGSAKAGAPPVRILGWTNFIDRDVQARRFALYLDGILALDPAAYTNATVPYFGFIRDQYTAQGLGNFSLEVRSRMENLDAFAAARGHIWVGAGPYYLHDYSFLMHWITLRAFEDYPDDPDRWFFLLDPLP